MLKYKPRPGVVLTKMCGVYFLIPLRCVTEVCKGIQPISLIWMMFWRIVEQGKPLEIFVNGYQVISRKSEQEILAEIESKCEEFCEQGYMIRVSDEACGDAPACPPADA